METKNLSNQISPVFTIDVQLQNVFLPEFPVIDEIILDYRIMRLKYLSRRSVH
jgi:uncharacterized protein YlaN (UPF0358 family)